jgi:hypothetical protein
MTHTPTNDNSLLVCASVSVVQTKASIYEFSSRKVLASLAFGNREPLSPVPPHLM